MGPTTTAMSTIPTEHDSAPVSDPSTSTTMAEDNSSSLPISQIAAADKTVATSPKQQQPTSTVATSTSSGSLESMAESAITRSDDDSGAYPKTFTNPWHAPKTPLDGPASITTTANTSANASSAGGPKYLARFNIRTLCLIGALLPGIGCYFCIAYTYAFQLDRVKNFTSTNCEGVKR